MSFPGNYRPQQQQQPAPAGPYQQPQQPYGQPQQQNYYPSAPQPYGGAPAPPGSMPMPGANGGYQQQPYPQQQQQYGGYQQPQQPYQSASPYGQPQGGMYGQPPQQPGAYGPQSTPAPYTPNTTPYPAPLQHQTHMMPPTANVPSIPTNVAWVNGFPRIQGGTKKALLIGINYVGQRGELRGCHADVNNVKKFLMECYGFQETPQTMVTLTDEPHLRNHQYLSPTRKNILAAMNWLVQGAKPGDSLFVHFSGHGMFAIFLTILPLDFERAGQITDDELHAVLTKNLPEGVRLTCIFDSCHSGTALDLPIVYMPDGSVKQRKTKADRVKKDALNIGKDLFLKKNKAGALMGAFNLAKNLATGQDDKKAAQVEQDKMSKAQVIMFSGCKDSQTSADAHIQGSATGAMSWALLKSLRANPGQSYTQVLQSTRDLLRAQYSQIPQLSSGHPLDMNAMLLL
ncbi:caspase domain-domain-containing protein [Catenaria anguillulae PL171]|uniref:Caspase domain-domain-containing protein n=1 Tax=Catenaria anguillulae PL171 TaxID=765915 RepID=A0A1Y2HXK1_9FUNG|nr:caspase domain-domain-containing protein [Catenaria anguillulae PL171]